MSKDIEKKRRALLLMKQQLQAKIELAQTAVRQLQQQMRQRELQYEAAQVELQQLLAKVRSGQQAGATIDTQHQVLSFRHYQEREQHLQWIQEAITADAETLERFSTEVLNLQRQLKKMESVMERVADEHQLALEELEQEQLDETILLNPTTH